jgi:hypothetical protein
MSLCLQVSGIQPTEKELTENGNSRLFAANRKRIKQSLLQIETENVSLFSLVGKGLTVIDDCCLSKRARSFLHSYCWWRAFYFHHECA